MRKVVSKIQPGDRKVKDNTCQYKTQITVGVIIIVIFGIGAIVIDFITSQKNPTQYGFVTSTMDKTPTSVHASTPVRISPPPSVTPIHTHTDDPIIFQPTITPSPDPLNNQDWRILPYSNGELYSADNGQKTDWDNTVAEQARNLSIPNPYHWEVYGLPGGTRYSDIKDYYIPLITSQGYSIGMDADGANGTYLLSFIQGSGSGMSKIVIQFWTQTSESPPTIILFYLNP